MDRDNRFGPGDSESLEIHVLFAFPSTVLLNCSLLFFSKFVEQCPELTELASLLKIQFSTWILLRENCLRISRDEGFEAEAVSLRSLR